MKILLAGATGRTGMRILDRLSGQEYEVTALVRNPGKARSMLTPDIPHRVQDLRDYSGFDGAVQGMDAVIFAAGSTGFGEYWSGGNQPRHIDYEAVRQMAIAADNHGVKKFILVSSMGVRNPLHFLNLFGRVLHWKNKGEAALRATHLNYSIIRPGQLIDQGYFPDQIQLRQDDKVHYKPVSRAEVAEVVNYCLAYPQTMRTTFELYRGNDAQPDAVRLQLEKLVPDEARLPYQEQMA